MTATTTTLATTPTKRILERLRRAAARARSLAAAIHARWRAEMVAGQFGPEAEAVIGRGTGARV